MKPTVSDIARAAIDAALDTLKVHGMENESRHLWKALREDIADHEVTLVATITTPSGDSGALKERLSKELSEKFGRAIEIIEKKDHSIIGGVIIEFGDELIDMSMKAALTQAKSSLSQS